MTPIVAFSRKRQVWVVYERPSRRVALANALATTEPGGCLPSVWGQLDGDYTTKADAEASTLARRSA